MQAIPFKRLMPVSYREGGEALERAARVAPVPGMLGAGQAAPAARAGAGEAQGPASRTAAASPAARRRPVLGNRSFAHPKPTYSQNTQHPNSAFVRAAQAERALVFSKTGCAAERSGHCVTHPAEGKWEVICNEAAMFSFHGT